MNGKSTKTKDMIPRQRSFQFPRPRIMTLLSEIPDFSVTVVKAGAGYGKTTAVAEYLRQSGLITCWLTVRGEYGDVVRFVERLIQTVLFEPLAKSDRERVVLAAHSPATWLISAQIAAELINYYVHDERIVVLDDFHLLDLEQSVLSWVDEWLRHLPSNIHCVIISRTMPGIPSVESLTLHGEILFVRERGLAFTEYEIGFMFGGGREGRNSDLDHEQVRWLLLRTGGMAIVLSILHREWRQYGEFCRLQAALDSGHSLQDQVGRLFMDNIDATSSAFLHQTCLLSTLHPDHCNQMLGRDDSRILLTQMERKGYITTAEEEPEVYVLHPLVRDYLAKTLTPDERKIQLESAISWHVNRKEEPKVIPYLFQIDDKERVTKALFTYIPKYLKRGHVSTVRGWLNRLSPETVTASPGLLLAQAEIDRHANAFSNACDSYQKAYEKASFQDDRHMMAQVQMARARFYLDTVQPDEAQKFIRAARNLIGRERRNDRLAALQLAFENSINRGKMLRAKRLLYVLTSMHDATLPQNNSDVRLLLRTGRIEEVIRQLKPRVSRDETDGRIALSHREATLLLSLMYVMYGEPDKAGEQALAGHRIGHSLQAPFVSAVGYIRMGHAEHLQNPLSDSALRAYEAAVEKMDEMEVPRGKSEALMGLCLSHGYRHQFAIARSYAQQGITIAASAGDVWMAHLIRVVYGQVCVINRMYEDATEQLTLCERAFQMCSDPFLTTVARLWRAIARYRLGDAKFTEDFVAVLDSITLYGYSFLLERPTYCGPRDLQILTPLIYSLHQLKQRKEHQNSILGLLHQLMPKDVERPPGYTLRVRTLGDFSVWRGFDAVSHKEWKREKARQLFGCLLTYRGTWLQREEICDLIWASEEPMAAERDFKVALNVLSNVLDPGRKGRETSAFVLRQGSMYALTSDDILQVDKDLFILYLHKAQNVPDLEQKRRLLSFALSLYQGDYLPEHRYEPWCQSEGERLFGLFIGAAVELIELQFYGRRFQEALEMCDKVLKADPAREDVYVWQMRIYGALYNRHMVMQTFRVCERVLHKELGMEPMAETRRVMNEMMGNES